MLPDLHKGFRSFTTLGLCAVVPRPYSGSDYILTVFGTENRSMLCAAGLTHCVTGFGQVLY